MELKIYFPRHRINCISGFLYGHFKSKSNTFYVTQVSEKQQSCKNNELLGFYMSAGENTSVPYYLDRFYNSNISIVLRKSEETIYAISLKHPENKSTEIQKYSIILYDFNGLFNTISYNNWYLNKKNTQSSTKNDEIINEKDTSNTLSDPQSIYELFDAIFYQRNKKKNTTQYTQRNNFVNILDKQVTFMFFLINCGFSVLEKIGKYSSFITRLFLKLKMIFKLDKNSKSNYINTISAVLIDSLLGYLVYVWITSKFGVNFIDNIWRIMPPFVNYIGKEVNLLIDWLMGIPIGLKLNHPLNQFLGKFFLHHVKLWLEYIRFLLDLPIPKYLDSVFPLVFYSGLSTSLALLSDAVSVLTFHVYCFYVYAARVYGLQVTGLLSFWRLFIGRKWNPLRQRVDTLTQPLNTSGQRFFVGTLVFTILLFLLPTVALYYGIFAIFRVGVIAVQKTLLLCQHILCFFPWYTLWLRQQYPLAFPGKVSLEKVNMGVENEMNKGCSWFETQQVGLCFEPQSYRSIIAVLLFKEHADLMGKSSVREVIYSLFSGKLLKWV